MNPIAFDIVQYIRQIFTGVDAFDSVRSANKEFGVLVEESDNTYEALLNTESATVTVTVRDNGMGARGTARAYELASKISLRLRLVMDVDIEGTHYDRITTTSSPREIWGGADASVWRFTLSVDRQIEGITWH